jgi:hypothetical protein
MAWLVDRGEATERNCTELKKEKEEREERENERFRKISR